MATMRRDSRTDDQPAAELRKMTHLKTKEECRLGNETIQVWTVELPSKHAEGILRAIKDNVPGQDSVDLQHLRRFAKPKYLPAHVLGKRDLVKEMYNVSRAWEATPSTVMQAPATTAWEYSVPAKGRANGRPSTLHLLVCPTRIMDLRTLHSILSQYTPFSSSADSWAYPLEIKEITVPLLAPTSPRQANTWSEEYWPTFYRKTNPFGAHPASIEKAENELHNPQEDNTSVDEALALAERAGDEALRRGIGAGTGVVIMERVDGETQIIAVAGDARHKPQANAAANDSLHPCCEGSPMGHAIMRAVGMVGRKRLRCASQPVTRAAAKAESNFTRGGLEHDTHARDAFFLDLPITPLEEEYFKKDNLKPDGYLCLKLEVFLTHEPCMMCSMALVHSRVGRVVFKNRMPQTGGLTAELVRNDSGPVGLGYGLCWRKELNWQFMCWEYMRTDEQGTIERQDLRKDSMEKYQEAEDVGGGELANVHSNSFARMHV
ncbi:tRNA-specific adenosine deaminase subunit tad3 [Lecanosticta acicola]|uniref:tRNA-specific adenosine deaminase subunit tad3 n=1 Tax=Lecanosticta acicola TaxID=111012 RepID=A0AAI8Z2D4_9PEZI|nr:tRNA-specific adenosine deaminase subunit tad3 [Lecanosticta acicola]